MNIIIEAIITFLGANTDELFILMTLYLGVGNTLKRRDIITGQYIGLFLLIFVSFIGSLGTTLMPEKYIPLLGLIPIFLGIKELITHIKSKNSALLNETSIIFDKPQTTSVKRIAKIAVISIASGADNIGLYIPLFAQQTYSDTLITIAVFVVLLPIWSLLAQSLSKLKVLRKNIHQVKDILVPLIFIGLGIYILFG